MKSFVTILVLSLLLVVGVAWGQTTYTWNVASGDWGTASNWTPTRSVPVSNDILVFDGSTQATPTVTLVPAQTIGRLRIINNASVTFSSAVASPGAGTLARASSAVTGTGTSFDTFFAVGDFLFTSTNSNVSLITAIGGPAALTTAESGTISAGTSYGKAPKLSITGNQPSLDIASGSSLTLSSSTPLIIFLTSGATGAISGTITFSNPHRLDAADAGAITFNSGSTLSATGSFAGNAFSNGGTAGSVVFASGSTYISGAGANPFGPSGTSAKVVFQKGSWFRHVQNSLASFSTRKYANFDWNIGASNSQTQTGSGLCYMDTLVVTSGTLTVGMTGGTSAKFKIFGDVTVAVGATLNFNPSSAASVWFQGSGLQTVTNNGTMTFGANQSITLFTETGSPTSPTVVFASPVTIPGTITASTGCTLATAVTLTYNSATAAAISGTLQLNQGGSIAGTGAVAYTSGTLSYNGTSAQTTTDKEFPSSNGPSNLTISNAAGVTLHASRTISGALTLTSGNLATGSNALSIGSTGSVARTSGHIIGNLNKVYSATGTKTFEVGTANGYSPVTVNATAGTGDFTVAAVQGAHPNVVNITKSLQRYWTLTSNGITAADLTFQYLVGDVSGNEPIYQPGKYDGGWSFPAGVVNTGTHSMFVPGVTSFSDWTMGEPGALPIQLSSFTAAAVSGVGVRLEWKTISEVNNYGFEVQRSANRESGYQTISPLIAGHGTTNQKQQYNYTDNSAGAGEWFYRLKQIDLDGSVHYAEILKVGSGAAIEQAPKEFALLQNYPNPFNPATDIKFSVESTGYATMELFNAIGQRVATLFDGVAQEGQYYSVRLDASNLASGTYFYRLQSGKMTEMRKLLLLR